MAELKVVKAQWNRFQRAFEKLAEADQTSYKELSKSQKAQFRDAWEKDPSWDFVQTFKRRAKINRDQSVSSVLHKTLKQLQSMLGKKKVQSAMCLNFLA